MDKRYVNYKDGKRWALVKGTENRRGGFVPMGGFKKAIPKQVYVGPGESPRGFNELKNHLSFDIGEIVSVTSTSNKWGDGILYHIASFSGFAAVKRPCELCIQKKENCECDIHISALVHDYQTIVATLGDDITKPFPINLNRKFAVRLNKNHSSVPEIPTDRLTKAFSDGWILEPPANVHFDKERPHPALAKAEMASDIKNKILSTGVFGREQEIQTSDFGLDSTVLGDACEDSHEDESSLMNDTVIPYHSPHGSRHFCYACLEGTVFERGKCSVCLSEFAKTMDESGTILRYPLQYPESMKDKPWHEKLQHAILNLFEPSEITINDLGVFTFHPEKADRRCSVSQQGKEFMEAGDKTSAYDMLDAAKCSGAPNYLEKHALMQTLLIHNLQMGVSVEYDHLLRLPEKLFRVVTDRENMELGPISENSNSRTLMALSIRFDLETQMRRAIALYKRMFDWKTYNMESLDLVYDGQRGEFLTLDGDGK